MEYNKQIINVKDLGWNGDKNAKQNTCEHNNNESQDEDKHYYANKKRGGTKCM